MQVDFCYDYSPPEHEDWVCEKVHFIELISANAGISVNETSALIVRNLDQLARRAFQNIARKVRTHQD